MTSLKRLLNLLLRIKKSERIAPTWYVYNPYRNSGPAILPPPISYPEDSSEAGTFSFSRKSRWRIFFKLGEVLATLDGATSFCIMIVTSFMVFGLKWTDWVDVPSQLKTSMEISTQVPPSTEWLPDGNIPHMNEGSDGIVASLLRDLKVNYRYSLYIPTDRPHELDFRSCQIKNRANLRRFPKATDEPVIMTLDRKDVVEINVQIIPENSNWLIVRSVVYADRSVYMEAKRYISKWALEDHCNID
ncbi:hypothetical protein [Vibrio diazotrophicus]|uniref:hypothetical protein n=1 Tax=Vibrio diazotrophicus TaxID=685 RepID=UPI000C9EA35D|nr:hypothetical protein [Vibrio diazotrophicus]PNH77782.1 hypothetical protein C1N27_19630 [Vibrio diazotrophicus]